MATKCVVNHSTMDAIASAIIAKGGASAPMKPSEMAAAIEAIPSGGGGEKINDVNFYLPDGTIAKSYSADEFAELALMPNQPALDGLTAQGWNWTLAAAKSYVAAYGKLNIGGMYVTDNGETRLYLTIAEPYRLEQPLLFGRSGGAGITIDWGDGSEPVTYTHTAQTLVTHAFPDAGDYIVRMRVVGDGEILLGGSSAMNIFGRTSQSTSNPALMLSSRLRKVEIGSSVTSIGSRAFYNCTALTTVIIPSTVTGIGESAFYSCYSLRSVVVPPSVTSITGDAFYNCGSLLSAALPSTVTVINGSAFYGCSSLLSVTLPPSMTSVGGNSFYGCTSLAVVTIPSSVTSIGSSTFYNCYALLAVTIPTSVTSIGSNAFYHNVSLSKVQIPSSVTSIGGSTFCECYSLLFVTVPSSVTSIGSNAFYRCYGVQKYDFASAVSVPALANANAFAGIADNCKIVVPDALYDEWIAATNWSATSIVSHIVKASEYQEG